MEEIFDKLGYIIPIVLLFFIFRKREDEVTEDALDEILKERKGKNE